MKRMAIICQRNLRTR